MKLPPDNWRLSKTVNPAGPLSATGIHMVDLSIAFLGDRRACGRGWRNWAAISRTATRCRLLGATAMLGAVLATPFGSASTVGVEGWMEIRDRSHPQNSTGWDVVSVQRDERLVSRFYPRHPAARDNLEAFGRAALGEAAYPVRPDEMLSNVRSFEAIQRSVKSGGIENV